MFQEAFERIKETLKIRTKKQLAEFLGGISSSSISDAKKRDSIPSTWDKHFYEANVNPRYIRYGEGTPYLDGRELEEAGPDQPREPKKFQGLSPETIQTAIQRALRAETGMELRVKITLLDLGSKPYKVKFLVGTERELNDETYCNHAEETTMQFHEPRGRFGALIKKMQAENGEEGGE